MTATPAPIRIHLTRQPRLIAADGVAVPLSRKDAALLAILAVDEAASKDRIAQMLWPREHRHSSLLNLRQRRFRLGRAAGVPLVVGDDMLRLSSVAEAPLDTHDPRVEAEPAAPEAELLDGLAYHDCPEFAEWLEQARGTWRDRLMARLERDADRLESDGLLAQALVLSRRIASADPLSDRAHRRLIWQLFLQGNMGAAMSVHQAFCERLSRELGEFPDDATRDLVARMRLGEFSAPGVRLAPPASGWRPRLVGREPLLEALDQAWRSHRPVLIEGAPGIGKTRLMTEAMRRLGARRCLHLAVYAGATDRPYAVLARLLGTLWFGPQALCPQGHLTLPDWARRELSALLPELAPVTATGVQPHRLLRAVEVALTQADLELIVLDDLQQVDLATLELLPALAQPALPPWWLACRTGERPPCVDDWIRAAGAPLMLEVQPLDRPAIGALLADVSSSTPLAEDAAAAVHRASGGLPLLVVELIKAMVEGRHRGTDQLPLGIARHVLARESCLDADARQLARAAAVLRAPLPPEAAAGILGDSAERWRQALGALVAIHWVDADARLHDVIATTLLDALPSADRKSLHAQIAHWMERVNGPCVEAAQHHEAADRHALAAPLYERAAQDAGRAARVAEQARFQQQAAACWQASGQLARAFDALRASVGPLTMSLGAEAARPVAERLLSLARWPRQHLLAHLELADLALHLGHYAEAEARARQHLGVAEALKDIDATLQIGAILAYALGGQARHDEAFGVLAQLQGLLGSASVDSRRHFLGACAAVCWQSGQLEQCAVHTQAQLDLLIETEQWSDATVELSNLAAILTQQGRFDKADALLRSSQAWREVLGPLEGHMQAGLDLTRAVTDIGLGRLARAQQAAQRALMACQRAPALGRIGERAADQLTRIHLCAGQTTAARETQALLPTDTPAQQVRAWLLMAAIEHAERAQPEPSLTLAKAAAAESRDPLLMLRAAAEEACIGHDPLDPQAVLALETQALAAEQAALAARLAWHRVGALLTQGQASEAAALVRLLMESPAHPEDILPCHWLDLAARALRAVWDPQAPDLFRRAQQAYAATADGLGSVRPPARTWPRFPDSFLPSTHPALPVTPMPGQSGSARPTLRSTP